MTTYLCARVIRASCEGTTDDPVVIYCPEHQAERDKLTAKELAHLAQEIDAAFRAAARLAQR